MTTAIEFGPALVATHDLDDMKKRAQLGLRGPRAALFLTFDATFTTGAELPVDGGLSEVDTPA